ncbi:MAG: hypothetical protein RLZZ324_564, partial [Candidatus Parcubacteria bacterium]
MTQVRTYLDDAASTPLCPEAREAMFRVSAMTGNPTSMHAQGRALRAEIDTARAAVAALLGVQEEEVVFTSGASEADGLAVRGVLRAVRAAHLGVLPRVAVSGIEHAAVLATVHAAEADGQCVADVVDAGKDGVVSVDAVRAAITPETVLVAVMWVNNVIGTVQPVRDIGAAVKAERVRRVASVENGKKPLPIVFLCDAVQALRTEDAFPHEAGIDLMAISSHKIYGPRGMGALIIAPGTPYASPLGGGGHEGGRRHGTENVEAIAGFGAAARVLRERHAADRAHAVALRDALIAGLAARIPEATLVCADSPRVPGTVFLRFPRMNGDEVALRLDAAGIAVSAGSACDAGTRK